MKTIRVYKADPIVEPVETIRIEIGGDIAKIPFDVKILDMQYLTDAQAIFEALKNSLPGGTLDRLLYLLLQYKASHFRVSHEAPGTVERTDE